MTSEVDAITHHYPAPRGEDPIAPPPAYLQWREEAPLTRVTIPGGRQAWLVTRFDDARAALRDDALSSDRQQPHYPSLGTAVDTPPLSSTFITLDGAEHARIRRMMMGEFTSRRGEELRPQIQQMADGLIRQMVEDGAPADLVSRFAMPLASQVICLTLGIPYAEHESFGKHVFVATDSSAGDAEKDEARTVLAGMLFQVIEAQENGPKAGLIGRMLDRTGTEQITKEELLLNVALVLGAGFDTSVNMITLGTLALLREPERLDDVRGEPGLITNAIEELLRYLTIVQLGLTRVAVRDTTLGGQLVRAGEGVVISLPSANWDARTFSDPETLDLRRPNAGRHLTFGHGAHQCLGQSLARVELQVALSSIVTAFPDLRLATSDDDLRFTDAMDFYGLHELMIEW